MTSAKPVNHDIKISFTPGTSVATWSLDGKQPRPISAQVGDTVTFTFIDVDPVAIQEADRVLLSGPRKHKNFKSPFKNPQINVAAGEKISVENAGLYGFALAFTTLDPAGVNAFYFLPDPELDVGSNG